MADLPTPVDPRLPVVDPGGLLARVGGAARDGGNLELAAMYLRSAVDVARDKGHRFGELVRSTDLLRVLDQMPGHRAGADALATDLRSRLNDNDGGTTADLYLLHVLSDRPGVSASAALPDLRRAADLLEGRRRRIPPGRARAHLDIDYPVYQRMLRRQRDASDPLADQFATLQQVRARRLVEALTARTGDDGDYVPPGVAEAVALLGRLSPPATLVDVVVTDTGLRAYLVDADGIRAVDAAGDLTPLSAAFSGDARRRPAAVLRELRRSSVLLDLVTKISEALAPGSSVLLSVDDSLANVPFHAIPFNGRPWGDHTMIGRIPAVAVLRFTDPDRRWSGHCIVAGDSDGTLPGARQECERVATLLDTTALLGPDCTLGALRSVFAASADVDIVHIAVHGRADVRRGGRSSLLFTSDATADDPRWAGLDDLFDGGMRADLIVFSGCSTAVAGPRDGAGLYGISQSAAEAGATTVLASLWPVDDTSAAIFMTAFYEELTRQRQEGAATVDLRDVTDHARRALRTSLSAAGATVGNSARDGREIVVLVDGPDEPDADVDNELRDMLNWAPFVLIGDPRLAV